MIKIAICDDEISIAKAMEKEMIKLFISLDMNAEVSLITDNQQELISAIRDKQVDALFLDINFKQKGINGIELAKKLRKLDNNFYLTFTTSHPECTFHVFDCKTFDYIVKPATTDKLIKNLKRLKVEFQTNPSFLLNINRNTEIRASDILFIERLLTHSIVHTKNEEFTCSISLKKLITQLPSTFIQNHRSFIVNTEAIQKVDRQQKNLKFLGNKYCPIGKLKLNISKEKGE